LFAEQKEVPRAKWQRCRQPRWNATRFPGCPGRWASPGR
jgi:hypothetical protein